MLIALPQMGCGSIRGSDQPSQATGRPSIRWIRGYACTYPHTISLFNALQIISHHFSLHITANHVTPHCIAYDITSYRITRIIPYHVILCNIISPPSILFSSRVGHGVFRRSPSFPNRKNLHRQTAIRSKHILK
jgi:hypothetical protein